MRPNWRSSGVATADAIVSGLAPGKPAETEMTGNSTCGSGATGRNLKASAPERSRNIHALIPCGLGSRFLHRIADLVARESLRQPVKPQIHDWGCVEREQLAEKQSADNRDAERMAKFRAGAAA